MFGIHHHKGFSDYLMLVFQLRFPRCNFDRKMNPSSFMNPNPVLYLTVFFSNGMVVPPEVTKTIFLSLNFEQNSSTDSMTQSRFLGLSFSRKNCSQNSLILENSQNVLEEFRNIK
jgi:hypothetical protein